MAAFTALNLSNHANDNGRFDRGERSDVTNAFGRFEIDALRGGTYRVRVVLLRGEFFDKTFPKYGDMEVEEHRSSGPTYFTINGDASR